MSQHNRGVVAIILITALALSAVITCSTLDMDNNAKEMDNGTMLGYTYEYTNAEEMTDTGSEPLLGTPANNVDYDMLEAKDRLYFTGWLCSGDGKLYRSFDDVPAEMMNSTFTGMWGYKVTFCMEGVLDGEDYYATQYVPAGWCVETPECLIGKSIFTMGDITYPDGGGSRGGFFSFDYKITEEIRVFGSLINGDKESKFAKTFTVEKVEMPYASSNLAQDKYVNSDGQCFLGWKCIENDVLYKTFDEVTIDMKGTTFIPVWGQYTAS